MRTATQVRRFEYTQGISNKYWEIWIEERAKNMPIIVWSHWGKINNDGSYQRKQFNTIEEANAFYEKMIKQKLAKFYKEVLSKTNPLDIKIAPSSKDKLPNKIEDDLGNTKQVRRIDL